MARVKELTRSTWLSCPPSPPGAAAASSPAAAAAVFLPLPFLQENTQISNMVRPVKRQGCARRSRARLPGHLVIPLTWVC